jgi:hypothetical protein
MGVTDPADNGFPEDRSGAVDAWSTERCCFFLTWSSSEPCGLDCLDIVAERCFTGGMEGSAVFVGLADSRWLGFAMLLLAVAMNVSMNCPRLSLALLSSSSFLEYMALNNSIPLDTGRDDIAVAVVVAPSDPVEISATEMLPEPEVVEGRALSRSSGNAISS